VAFLGQIPCHRPRRGPALVHLPAGQRQDQQRPQQRNSRWVATASSGRRNG